MPTVIDSDTTYNGVSGTKEIEQNNVRKKFTLTYLVQADSVNDREDTILATSGIPQINDRLRGASCRRVKATELETNALLWKVTADFDSKFSISDSSGGKEEELPPELRQPKWYWSAKFEQKDLLKDAITEETIVNAVEEPLPGTTREFIPVLNLTWYELSLDPNKIYKYSNKTNFLDFWGMPEKTVLSNAMTDQEVELTWEDETFKYREVSFSLEFYIEYDDNDNLVPGTTMYKPLSVASKYLENSGDDVDLARPFIDKWGHRYQGLIVNEGPDAGLKVLHDEAEYLEHNRYKTVDFNDLFLGPF